ncbi:MAG: glutamate synthase large subunit [Bdellovibrionales bacterium]|nr:glutamate synthase large subunit [Bdellovibrionales bacterium]
MQPKAQGLYDPVHEKDSCGIGLIAHIRGQRSHEMVASGLKILTQLSHRGAAASDGKTGDGAGILTQLPHGFFSAAKLAFALPAANEYGVAMVFLPRDAAIRKKLEKQVETTVLEVGASVLGWRDVPVNRDAIGPIAQATEPVIRQLFVGRGKLEPSDFERKLYITRKRCEKIADKEFYICSFSSQTIVYKGMMLPPQLGDYFPDLRDPAYRSALALVHSRFSTNTFPAWKLAHPYRYLCHNGEINTIRGNVNWMRARQGRLQSDLFGEDLKSLFPIVPEGQSDSACLDNAVEFLVMGGRSLPHAMMMLIPEPWVANPHMDLERRGFYEYHSAMMEPWDGPAAVCFTDGKLIGATLDRNGLRPCRYLITKDDRVILASEAGVLPIEPDQILQKGRLEPGRMFLVDTAQGRLIDDEEIKAQIAARKPYRSWVTRNRVSLDELPDPINVPQPDRLTLKSLQRAFGYTREELKMVLGPMVVTGEEPLSSMGNDTPLAVLSNRPQLLFKYFRQLFAQVTNPPIDPIREHLVMSLTTNIGPKPNLLSENSEIWRRIKVSGPIITNSDLEKIREIEDPYFRTKTLKMLFKASDGPQGLRAGVLSLCRQASDAINKGCRFIILSDRGVNAEMAPIPSLLAVAAVNNHLVRKSQRAEAGLIVESGEPRDVHHMACLLGYGAGSVNPYLAFESLTGMEREGALPEGIDASTAHLKYIKAVNKGLLKIFSKMGISTVQSYCGAQVFEAVGLCKDTIERYFTGTPSRVEGVGLAEIGQEVLSRHETAFSPITPEELASDGLLDPGGEIHYRIQGESHSWNPETIASLQKATREKDAKTFREFSNRVNANRDSLRSLLDFKIDGARSIAIDQVEPASEIVKRFTTGAMSFGALGKEAHETLAIAMNRLGAKSNSGEGGEDLERSIPLPNGDSKNSAIKQIASARFGVTSHYLMSAQELQIKMAQGAKPGEGGQLPGHKVDPNIARMRYSTPGVSLISPPPHHDIYSIEDLSQLIFDLKNANPTADVSVKLVSEVGVGTVAAGVVKAHADKILISGDNGGTGASPLSSIKYAGLPWELGLSETQQTLVLNGLRDRVRVEVDGQLRTGRDVMIAALLGAEEFGFSTAPLIVEGCIMMRKCHLNTCPVGIATQDPALRKKFTGQPEHVINYFFFVAEEVREILASLGFRTLQDAVGMTEFLIQKPKTEGHRPSDLKSRGLDLSAILYKKPGVPRESISGKPARKRNPSLESYRNRLGSVLDLSIYSELGGDTEFLKTLEKPVVLKKTITNVDRAVGTFLSSQITKKTGEKGLAPDQLTLDLTGSAGQSFGAFACPGVTLKLTGEANDYLGKGLSGARIIVRAPENVTYDPSSTILVGNTALYGATRGQAFLAGTAGERFAVRNSGATAVVEGTGDHGCEYMTGGLVVVLGKTGRNFAAGMSGGVALVLDEDGQFGARCNLAMVGLEPLMLPEEQEELKKLLQAHYAMTESTKAKKLLLDWEQTVSRFLKVMPVDYRRVLEGTKPRNMMTGSLILQTLSAWRETKTARSGNV